MEYPTSLDTIVLTEFQDSDASAIADYLGHDQEIHENLRELPSPYTLEHAQYFIRWSRELAERYGHPINFAIREKVSGVCVGSCGFDHHDLDSSTGEGEGEGEREVGLGYWIGKKYWGKGIGTAIVGALVSMGMGEYGYEKLYAPVFEWNIASQKVLLKNGFVKEKVLENYIEKDGKMVNAVKLSKTKIEC